MPAKHSRATRLAATFLARESGADAAAAAFGIDPRTVRGWLDTVELPSGAWTAIRDVLQARAGEMAAKGETRGLVQTLTGAGIADRNVRYSTLIARREARREAEPEPDEPDPFRVQVDRLDTRRQRLLRDEIDLLGHRRADGLDPTPEYDPSREAEYTATMVAFIDGLLAMTDEAVDARYAEIRAERGALEEAERERERIERERIEAEREAAKPPPRGFDNARNVTPRTRALETLIAEGEAMLADLG